MPFVPRRLSEGTEKSRTFLGNVRSQGLVGIASSRDHPSPSTYCVTMGLAKETMVVKPRAPHALTDRDRPERFP